MELPSTGIVKYHVKLSFEVDGLVEKADIIGAIFGQTEGLLGPEMNLNELQKVSKVGRIEVNVDTKSNVAKGDALIPMSTDISTAALIAAAIESIDKVGPFQAHFVLSGIDDIRAIKKKVIVDRAKKIVQEWATKTISEGEEMLKDVYDASKPGKLTTFGKGQLACGTGVFTADWIILVEGRADVINLLRAGFDNSIAIEGAKIDESITHLTEGKKVIAFLDGDRAGDLILKELHGLVKINKVFRAPPGREVEECTPLEITEILNNALDDSKDTSDFSVKKQQLVTQSSRKYNKSEREKNNTYQQIQPPPPSYNNQFEGYPITKDDKELQNDNESKSVIKNLYSQINETLEAIILDNSMNTIMKVPVSEIIKKLSDSSGGKILILDGIVTQRLIDASNKVGIEQIIGHRLADIKRNSSIKVSTFNEMGLP
ncbi:MAG TPA: DNA primase DnaG [Nitrososphaeraceae archaeon]|nr:DNA primase DnaG [Nitrososphaeraceae archaeon]